MKLAESLSPITKNLDDINKSTKNSRDVIKGPNYEDNIKALPNSSKFKNSMRYMIGSLMRSKNSLKTTPDELSKANILGVPIQISDADTIKTKENIYELTPQIYIALSDTGCTGKTVKNEKDILMMINIIRDLGYTGDDDRDSKRNIFFK